MEPAQTRKLLGLIGLGVRGRGAIVGVQQVREAARRGKSVADVSPFWRKKTNA